MSESEKRDGVASRAGYVCQRQVTDGQHSEESRTVVESDGPHGM